MKRSKCRVLGDTVLAFIFILFYGAHQACADGDAIGNRQSMGIKEAGDSQKSSICEYVHVAEPTSGRTGHIDFLSHVRGFYVHADSSFYAKEYKGIEVLQPEGIAVLAGCTLKEFFNMPVYLYDYESFYDWPPIKGEGNLVVDVMANLQKPMSLDSAQRQESGSKPMVVLTVGFYRSDAKNFKNPTESIKGFREAYCSRAFSYTSDYQKLKQLMSTALHQCLDKPFSSN
jgi:hypothetical protein